ncbi:taste receptor type 2 member 42-like [Dunckerocampus dactyliophorus]|uniref:taste receptor type 2 member 42-like n=1 Tax=Dunckerocampus dactyliophorus TaxID=161453 RepID=UPI002406222D|nr:taste receptor type 2 member 42-like [Dunckerocampus dactyliophorus]
MDQQGIGMSRTQFLIINGPLVIFCLVVNIFFVFCLGCPQSNDKGLKQPLKLLLEFLSWCSILYLILLVVNWSLTFGNFNRLYIVLWFILLFYVHNSMSAYVWLTFYYFTQIVPARHALFVWLRRNIKVTIFMAVLLDFLVVFYNYALETAHFLINWPLLINDNLTLTLITIHSNSHTTFLSLVGFIIGKVYMMTTLCIMIISSFTTLRYLHGHMRKLEKSGIPVSASRLRSRLRVTLLGICQSVIFFSCMTFNFIDSLTLRYADFFFGAHIGFTVSTLYIFGTTVNMAIGQSTFRQRAAALWWALKTQCSVGTGTNDLMPESADMAKIVTAT